MWCCLCDSTFTCFCKARTCDRQMDIDSYDDSIYHEIIAHMVEMAVKMKLTVFLILLSVIQYTSNNTALPDITASHSQVGATMIKAQRLHLHQNIPCYSQIKYTWYPRPQCLTWLTHWTEYVFTKISSHAVFMHSKPLPVTFSWHQFISHTWLNAVLDCFSYAVQDNQTNVASFWWH